MLQYTGLKARNYPFIARDQNGCTAPSSVTIIGYTGLFIYV